MEARKDPDFLRSVAEAVTKFREALTDFLELHVEIPRFGGDGQVNADAVAEMLPRDGADPEEITRRRTRVAQAAGMAATAVPLTGTAVVVGRGDVIDPITNWYTITRPDPLLPASTVLRACDQAIGRLRGLIIRAEAEQPPSIRADAMHPLVWGAASRLWRDGRYRLAVSAAADAIVLMTRKRLGNPDLAMTALWRDAFSYRDPGPGTPRLRWPGDPSDHYVNTMNAGLRYLASGIQMIIYECDLHRIGELDEQGALERLCALSLLVRWIDECDLMEAPASERGQMDANLEAHYRARHLRTPVPVEKRP